VAAVGYRFGKMVRMKGTAVAACVQQDFDRGSGESPFAECMDFVGHWYSALEADVPAA